jgi:hypothetical protein
MLNKIASLLALEMEVRRSPGCAGWLQSWLFVVGVFLAITNWVVANGVAKVGSPNMRDIRLEQYEQRVWSSYWFQTTVSDKGSMGEGCGRAWGRGSFPIPTQTHDVGCCAQRGATVFLQVFG